MLGIVSKNNFLTKFWSSSIFFIQNVKSVQYIFLGPHRIFFFFQNSNPLYCQKAPFCVCVSLNNNKLFMTASLMLIASSKSLLWQNIFTHLPRQFSRLNGKIFAIECLLCITHKTHSATCLVNKIFIQNFAIVGNVFDTQQISVSCIVNEWMNEWVNEWRIKMFGDGVMVD